LLLGPFVLTLLTCLKLGFLFANPICIHAPFCTMYASCTRNEAFHPSSIIASLGVRKDVGLLQAAPAWFPSLHQWMY